MAAVGGLGEVNSVSDLERKLAEIHIPWDEIAPAHIHEWLKVYLKCHGTSPELLLAEILPCITGSEIATSWSPMRLKI